MRDPKTLAYINLFAVLGAIPSMMEIVPEAGEILGKSSCSIGIAVKGGPSATLIFAQGRCVMKEGCEDCVIKLPFGSPEKFNGMIEGTVTPIPAKGFMHLPFLLRKFTKLTDLLSRYLRPTEEDLADPEFKKRSTTLLFGVIGRAIVQIGNHDKVGRASASYIVDGAVKLAITGGPSAAIVAKNHRLTYTKKVPAQVMSYMVFSDMDTARDLFDGKINSVAAVGLGGVRIGGMVSQVDNVNRILDRAALYLA